MFAYRDISGLSVLFLVIKLPWRGLHSRFTLVLSLGSRSHPKEDIYSSSHFSEVSAFSQGKLQKGFLLHLLKLRCLRLKITLIPTLRFQVGPTTTIERLETGKHWGEGSFVARKSANIQTHES